jgi:hypothetical protein
MVVYGELLALAIILAIGETIAIPFGGWYVLSEKGK